jgi:hypothetical protein
LFFFSEKLNKSDVFKCDHLLGRQQDILQGLTLDMAAMGIMEADSMETLAPDILDKIATLTGSKKTTDQVGKQIVLMSQVL